MVIKEERCKTSSRIVEKDMKDVTKEDREFVYFTEEEAEKIYKEIMKLIGKRMVIGVLMFPTEEWSEKKSFAGVKVANINGPMKEMAQVVVSFKTIADNFIAGITESSSDMRNAIIHYMITDIGENLDNIEKEVFKETEKDG